MNWSKIENFIFDVDGTLYSQKNVRFKMLIRLISYYCIRFWKLKELHALYYFRKLREIEEYKDKSMEDLYLIVSNKSKLNQINVQKTIQRWMFTDPLDLLKKYKYKDLINFINSQHELGKTIIIYSDYPALDKLKTLQVNYDYIFVSGENGIKNQKPSLDAMEKIIDDTKIDIDKTIYVGDRDNRDKLSAEYVKIKYYDVKEFKKII